MSFALVSALSGALALAAVLALAWARGKRGALETIAAARAEAGLEVKSAALEAAALKRAAETEAREESLDRRARADGDLSVAREELARRE